MADIPFRREMAFEYGAVDRVSPLIRRVVARNPGPFTFHGTGTYIVGHGSVAVIDPGPALGAHVDALIAALGDETVSHILVTHTHLDHSPAARPLKQATGAKTHGFGPHGSGQTGPRRGSGAGPGAGPGPAVEEGGDLDFTPDVRLGDGDVVAGEGWTLTAVHTPGHTSNHLCFALAEENALFSGDHVMGWSTSVIAPPDGDMAAYMASLDRLRSRGEDVYWPTHGPPIRDPGPFVEAFVAHRHERERQILACLGRGQGTIRDMVATMYAEVPAQLHPAAACSVLAHLIHMVAEGRAACDGPPGIDARYAPTAG